MASTLAQLQAFARSYAGKPYVWGGCAASGSDCSGYGSIFYNLARAPDASPYHRQFGTGSIAGLAAKLGLRTGLGGSGDLSFGIMYPQESSSGIGHMAMTIGDLNAEERGSAGALVGSAARGATSPLFNHHFHLPLNGGESEWYLMADIPAANLDQIGGELVAQLRTGAGAEALRDAVRYVLKISDRLDNAIGTVNNDGFVQKVLEIGRANYNSFGQVKGALGAIEEATGKLSPDAFVAALAAMEVTLSDEQLEELKASRPDVDADKIAAAVTLSLATVTYTVQPQQSAS